MRHVSSLVVAGLALATALAACADAAEPTESAESLLARFDAMTLTEAQAEYGILDPAARVELWHAQLTRHLERGGLTAAQDAALRDLRDHLVDALGPANAAYEARMRKVMTEAEMFRYVGVLGDGRPAAPTTAEAPRPAGGERVGQAAEALFMTPNCNSLWTCSNGCSCQTSLSLPTTCFQDTCGSACTATANGCGFLLWSSCTLYGTSTVVGSCGGAP